MGQQNVILSKKGEEEKKERRKEYHMNHTSTSITRFTNQGTSRMEAHITKNRSSQDIIKDTEEYKEKRRQKYLRAVNLLNEEYFRMNKKKIKKILQAEENHKRTSVSIETEYFTNHKKEK